MLKIEPSSWWLSQPALGEDERVVFSYRANHADRRRVVGGALFVTTQRLLFVPSRLEAKLGSRAVEKPLAKLSRVGSVAPEYTLRGIFSGSWQERLCFEFSDGASHRFVVRNVAGVKRELQQHLRSDQPLPA